jgi:NAD(P)-dependent dehydrogenase (short-subunit alcohol dehydrogenase family)
MQPLQKRIALVTGAAQGLGAAVCHMLSDAGAVVILADVQTERAEQLAVDLQNTGKETEVLGLDVSDEQQTETAVRELIARRGRIDILVNNAGTDVTAPFTELSVREWDRVIDVNLRGPFLMAKQVFPAMQRQGGGSIVNIVSTAAKRAWANATAYHASKWGLLGLSHALHVEGRPRNIKVTAVIAGGMRTPFLLDRFPDLDPGCLQDPQNGAATVRFVLTQPAETVIPEIMVLPMRESSWP